MLIIQLITTRQLKALKKNLSITKYRIISIPHAKKNTIDINFNGRKQMTNKHMTESNTGKHQKRLTQNNNKCREKGNNTIIIITKKIDSHCHNI